MPAITPPVPTLVANQPVSGSTTTLSIALAYDSAGVVIPSPVFGQLPVAGDISLSFSPTMQDYDAYVASGLDAWSYAVKTGMKASGTFKTAAPGTDPIVGPLVKAALLPGNGAVALFSLHNPDDTYFSGTMVIGLSGSPTPVRGIYEYTFAFSTSGKITYTNS